jgi:hypothetical protein
MRNGFVCAVIAGALVAAAPLARAQMMFNQGGGGPFSGKPRTAAPPSQASRPAAPPALPGASSGSDTGTSASRADLEPTDALFDAINRGDISAARDAISRGADLRGQNVLGMTPLELSVDLGRNDISFMLLSMRGGEDRAARPAPTAAAAKPPVTRQAKQPPPHKAASVVATAPAPSQTARLFSGDGGAPNPNAGFLGFDSGRR